MSTLYYIRGNKKCPKSVQQALLNKNGIVTDNLSYENENMLYYIDQDNNITFSTEDTQEGQLIIHFGTELKLEEIFKPFDKVIVKYGNGSWTTTLFSYKTQSGKFRCGNDVFDECHLYEPWMEKYIGTNIPWDQF